jgi:hypothetical protein
MSFLPTDKLANLNQKVLLAMILKELWNINKQLSDAFENDFELTDLEDIENEY